LHNGINGFQLHIAAVNLLKRKYGRGLSEIDSLFARRNSRRWMVVPPAWRKFAC
jgi:hypothetical protein